MFKSAAPARGSGPRNGRDVLQKRDLAHIAGCATITALEVFAGIVIARLRATSKVEAPNLDVVASALWTHGPLPNVNGSGPNPRSPDTRTTVARNTEAPRPQSRGP